MSDEIMTPKMKMLYNDIVGSLLQLPDAQRIYLFGEDDEIYNEWVIGLADVYVKIS